MKYFITLRLIFFSFEPNEGCAIYDDMFLYEIFGKHVVSKY